MRRRRCIQAKGHARGLGSKRQILARQKRALAHPQRDDLTHLSGATGLFAKLPLDLLGVELEDLANIIAPLAIWLIKREEMPLVDRHGKKSLYF